MLVPETKQNQLHFSQCNISEKFASGDSVERWENREPFVSPIDIVQINSDCFISMENRRLYSAKKYSQDFDITSLARYHLFTDRFDKQMMD